MTVNEWLKAASEELADAMIPSARLDAEIILAHTLNKPRTWLHAHGDAQIDPRRKEIADTRVSLRLDRVPIAYIIGHKEFYGRSFNVNPSVLIPRPESEEIITQLANWLKSHPDAKRLVDVGTGSGALGITAAAEFRSLDVTLVDVSHDALQLAKKNADLHRVTVRTLKSDLLDDYPLRPDIILANLPYVDASWDTSPETAHEPNLALYADNEGLDLIYRLVDQAATSLSEDGVMILEADPRQHEQIIAYAANSGFGLSASSGFIVVFERKSS